MINNNLNHLSVIMDGNKRWAKKNGKTNIDAYNEGINRLKDLTSLCIDQNIRYLTVFCIICRKYKKEKILI